jgi:NAD(P)H-hydrate epimerase
VLVIAGSPGKIGAALLVAHGALRTGAGLVTLAAIPQVAQALETRVLEAMTARIDETSPEESLAPLLEQTDTVVIGPGLGFHDTAARMIEHVLNAFTGRVVVDADAISHFRDRAAALAGRRASLLLTPHPGELGRLLGTSASEVEADRFGAVERAAELTGATVLLKGAPTLVARRAQPLAVSPTGHPVLAAGGSGDVLSGCLGAILVSNEPFLAACAGAYVHGRAAEHVASERGVDRGVLAHEIADRVPAVIAGLSQERPFVSR